MGDVKEAVVELAAELKFHVASKPNKPRIFGGGAYCSAVDCHNCQRRDQPRGIQFYRDAIECCEFRGSDVIFHVNGPLSC